MITPTRLAIMWFGSMTLFGVASWVYGLLTVLFPSALARHGYIVGLISVVLFVFIYASGAVAGERSVKRAWDEGAEHDSHRAYRFGFNTAWVMYVVFWGLTATELVPPYAAMPAMAAFTAGSYSLFMGVVGIRGWHEARLASD